MPRRRSQPRRSVREWLARGGLAALAVVLGCICFSQTRGYSLRNSDPARAYALALHDGRVAGALAQKLLEKDISRGNLAHVRSLARGALLLDPTAVGAASALAIATQLRGDVPGARRLAAYAQALSRRDLRTQIWAIEDAVGRGDVAGALQHYDIALRTSRNASDLLFPVLTSAIADPAIRMALVRTLAHRPGWSTLFIEYASSNSPDPRATALLFRQLHGVGLPVSGLSQMLLLDALASRGLLSEAWSYYRSVHPGTDPRRSRDPAFMQSPDDPTIFDWQMIGTQGISASIQREGDHGVLDFAAVPSVGGPVAQQVQMLPAGRYRLVGRSAGVDQLPAARPYWSLTCRGGGELGRIELTNSAQADGVFAGRFDVPANCPAQVLTLIARPSDAVSGSSGRVLRVQLLPDTNG